MKQELVSVIVPIYNAENYLMKCLKSITEQTYKNLEIILIDDGSRDKSGIICDEFAKKDLRIVVIHKENTGVADCRNIGLECSNGRYIAWIDADDYIDKYYIETMYISMYRNNSDIVQCRFKKVRDDRYIFETKYFSERNYLKDDVLQSYAEEHNSVSSIYLWDKLFKKELFEGLRFPIRKNSEDRAILCQILARIKIFTQVENIMYAYRLSENSLTRCAMNYEFINSAIDTENERLEFFKNLNDDLLYHKAMIAYEKVMIATYSRCLLLMYDKILAEKIFKLFKKYYRSAIDFKDIGIVRKIQFIFFRYLRNIYVYTIFKIYNYKGRK